MRRALSFVGKMFLFLISAILLYGLIAVLLSIITTRPSSVECAKNREVYIASNGIHLDIILSPDLFTDEKKAQFDLFTETQYVAFGWGDKDFYVNTPTWGEMTFWITFKALFLKSDSIVHVTQHNRKYKHWKEVDLCEAQMDALLAYIWSSFEYEENGRIVALKNSGYATNDTFYEAEGSYSILRTCNNWVNIGLKKAQVKTALWSPFGFGAMRYL